MKPLLLETWNGLLDLLYPPKCMVCGAMGLHPLCAACRDSFMPLLPPVCARCGIPSETDLCAGCRPAAPYHFVAARAAGRYEGALREAILRLKYREKRALAAPLGEFLAAFLQSEPFGPARFDLLLPVPLHPSRLRQRGFNQAALLAREVGKALALPVLEKGLHRIRRTRPQAEIRNNADRAANVRDAFAADDSDAVRRKTILLIDDVITTCHTVDECARVLVEAGAKALYVAAVARGG